MRQLGAGTVYAAQHEPPPNPKKEQPRKACNLGLSEPYWADLVGMNSGFGLGLGRGFKAGFWLRRTKSIWKHIKGPT